MGGAQFHGRARAKRGVALGWDVGNGICLSSTMAGELSQAQTLPHATQMASAATHSCTHTYTDG